MPAKILLVDDHQLLRQGLRLILRGQRGMTVVGEAGSGEQAWLLVQKLRPDLVIADIEMPGGSGLELARRIRTEFSAIRVVILTGHSETATVTEALQAGVAGYVLKTNAADELVEALRTVLAGQTHISQEVSAVLVEEYQRKLIADVPALSKREAEVLKRVADGETTKEIAFALEVSSKTIETHRLNVMEKVGIRSVAGLTKYAVREGITTL